MEKTYLHKIAMPILLAMLLAGGMGKLWGMKEHIVREPVIKEHIVREPAIHEPAIHEEIAMHEAVKQEATAKQTEAAKKLGEAATKQTAAEEGLKKHLEEVKTKGTIKEELHTQIDKAESVDKLKELSKGYREGTPEKEALTKAIELKTAAEDAKKSIAEHQEEVGKQQKTIEEKNAAIEEGNAKLKKLQAGESLTEEKAATPTKEKTSEKLAAKTAKPGEEEKPVAEGTEADNGKAGKTKKEWSLKRKDWMSVSLEYFQEEGSSSQALSD